MKLEDHPVYKFHKKHERFIMAVEGILIIILLAIIWRYAYNDYQIKQEISQTCGWGEERYYCYCEKSESIAIKNLLENSEAELNITGITDVQVDR